MNVQTGETLDGRYVLLTEIGHGGMGVVYKAKHLQFDKFVAIKMLSAKLIGDKTQLLRFRREAKILAGLVHPNIVAVQAFGCSDDSTPYIVMELVEGDSLMDFRPADDAERYKVGLRIFEQVCEALTFIHSQGIIHRDIKPPNIIVTKDENGEANAKLIDFGTGRLFDLTSTDQRLTETGVIVGSPPYMGPEQWTGTAADERSDIYALGCVMYEYFTGQKYIQADNLPGILAAHLQTDPDESLHGVKVLDNEAQIKAMIGKSLQRDPAERYQSAAELATDLRLIQSGGRVAVKPRTANSHQAKPKTKLPSGVTLSLVIALSVGAGAWISLDQLHRQSQARKRTTVNDSHNRMDTLFERIYFHGKEMSSGMTGSKGLRTLGENCLEFNQLAANNPPEWATPAQRVFVQWQLARTHRLLENDAAATDAYAAAIALLPLPSGRQTNQERNMLSYVDMPTACFDYAASCLRSHTHLADAQKKCKMAVNFYAMTQGRLRADLTEKHRRYEWSLGLYSLVCRANNDTKGESQAIQTLASLLQSKYEETKAEARKHTTSLIGYCDSKVKERYGVSHW